MELYPFKQKITQVNMGGWIDKSSVKYLVFHFIGASGQALANANYFYNVNRNASAHLFIDPKEIYQVVPFNRVAWHVGDGRGAYGITNQNSIGVELCQDVTTGSNVWQWDFHPTTRAQAILVFAKLMKEYNVPLNRVVRHWDASRKSCPGNWMANDWEKWKLWKKDLETYVTTGRLVDSQRGLDYSNGKTSAKPTMTNAEVASQVLKGLWGNGQDRKTRLTNAGYNYDAVQAEVQKQKSQSAPSMKVTQQPSKTESILKSLKDVATEVINGLWGVGSARKSKLESAGYNYNEVQGAVNDIVKGVEPKTESTLPKGSMQSMVGKYKFLYQVNVRTKPNLSSHTLTGLHYKPGEIVVIESNITTNGYIWGIYRSYSGQTRYVALKPIDGEPYVKKV